MTSLVIAQIAGIETARFEVVRQSDGARSAAVELPSPYGFAVRNRPGEHLMSRMAWYLERFLEYPFPPRIEQAVNVEDALEEWGRNAFNALFASGLACDWITEAKRAGTFSLQIVSDDPATLSWPWEALCDPEMGLLAHCAQVERRLNCELVDPPPLSDQLPKNLINILLVTPRPYDADVQFRSISRPLAELIESGRLAARIHLLRPPTFDNLREHLAGHWHTYHILHFDGHGSYEEGAGAAMHSRRSRGPQGELVFEDKHGRPAPVSADELSNLLREHSVPIVVLTACRSAMIDTRAADPFACLAAAMLRSGIRSVVAMAYSLYVRAAQEFLPAFYETLFETGSVPEAARKGRIAMSAHPQRSAIAPEVKLRDWLVPVVYQQETRKISFAAPTPRLPSSTEKAHDSELPKGARLKSRYAFTGRDGALLELERAMQRSPAGILIHGLAGVGKTTLTQAFVRWLRITEGLGHGCFWFSFDDIHSANHVLNEMGRSIFGPQFGLESMDVCLDQLVQVFRANPFLIVWDNFESVCGVPDTGIAPMLSSSDQGVLRRFLEELRGTSTKVLITSRSHENWLPAEDCLRLRLRGLQRDEMWDYAAQIMNNLSIEIERQGTPLVQLLESLGGHPIVMQTVLLQLKNRTIDEVRAALEQNFAEFVNIADGVERRLYASLSLIRQSLPEALKRLLIPLGLHDRFVDTVYLETMARSVDKSLDSAQVERFTSALVPSGLLTELGSSIYEIHPLLPSFLRVEVLPNAGSGDVGKWTRAFVDVMARLADEARNREFHEQRPRYAIHHANFHSALVHAERLELHECFVTLAQFLGYYAKESGNFTSAEQLFACLVDHSIKAADEVVLAFSYNCLGLLAQLQHNLGVAEKWYVKSLEICDKLGDERRVAVNCGSLGTLAIDQNDFAAAERWYFRCLEASEQLGDDQIKGITYTSLARMARKQRDFLGARDWYFKSLEINERLGDEKSKAESYDELGSMEQERHDFSAGERWYLKSLEIEERVGDEKGAAGTYQNLGGLEKARRNFAAAERWYLKSLEIDERLGDETGAASTYHELGSMAQEQRDFGTAEKWYVKSLQIAERHGDQYPAASIYHQLGVSAQEQGDFDAAEKWYLKALEVIQRLGDESLEPPIYHQLGVIAHERGDYRAAERWHRRALEINEKFGNEYWVCRTYHELGMIAARLGDFESAEQWYLKSVEIATRLEDEDGVGKTFMHLGILAVHQERFIEAVRWLAKAMAGFLRTKDTAGAQKTARIFLAAVSRAPAESRCELRKMWEKARINSLAEDPSFSAKNK